MSNQLIDMRCLFSQLGLESDIESISQFIDSAAPLRGDVLLHEAPYWSASQARFLREALSDDADWAEVVDALNVLLHDTRQPGLTIAVPRTSRH